MADPPGAGQIIYMPDTNVLSLIADGDATVIPEVLAMRARGVKFIVPMQTVVEIQATTNVAQRAKQLALIRDLGMDVQPAGMRGAMEEINPAVRKMFLDKNPQLIKTNVSNEQIRDYMKANTEFAAKVAKMQSPVSKAGDRLYLLDVKGQTAAEGGGKQVMALTYERFAGDGPQGSPGQKKRIALEFGVTVAPESRRIQRRKPEGTEFIRPEHLWELHPALRGKTISSKVVEPNGALGRPTATPAVPSAPPTQLRYRGSLGAGLKIVGTVLIEVLIAILMQWVTKKLVERWQKEVFDEDMTKYVTPKLIGALDSSKEAVLSNLADGKKAFAKVQLKYFRQIPSRRRTEYTVDDPFTHVYFERLVGIVDEAMPNAESSSFYGELFSGARPSTLDNFIGVETTYEGERITYTIPLTYSSEEIELYRMYRDLILICMMEYMDCDPELYGHSQENADGQAFWMKEHKFFVEGLATALRQAPRPTML